MEGGSVTRDSAFHLFGIQNITARLSELTDRGFDIVRTTEIVTNANGRKMKVTHWKLRYIPNAGDMVQVIEDAGAFISLKGKVGSVRSIDRYGAMVTVDFPQLGMRRIPQRCVRKLNRLPVGTPVALKSCPLVVGSYVPEGDSYLLLTPFSNLTVAASASLVCAADAQQ